MRRTWKFLIGLIVGLCALTLAADQLMQSTLRRWSERDLQLRGELALHGAQRFLLSAWQSRDLNQLNPR